MYQQLPKPTAGFTYQFNNTNCTYDFTNTSIDNNYNCWNFANWAYSNDVNPNHSFFYNDTYTTELLVFNYMGLSQLFTEDIVFNYAPEPTLNESITECYGETIVLDPGVFDSYLWYYDGSENQELSVTESETYIVEVTNQNNCSAIDTCIVTFEDCTFVLENEIGNIKVYPNPAKDFLYIDLENENIEFDKINFYDISGKVVLSSSLRGTKQSIDISDLENGIYYVRVGKQIVKFIKN